MVVGHTATLLSTTESGPYGSQKAVKRSFPQRAHTDMPVYAMNGLLQMSVMHTL